MSGEPVIGDYAVIGDCRSAALVDRHGAIDWCCLPEFDSPAVFCRLLDREKGGYWDIQPQGLFTASRRYIDGSNLLETVFRSKAAEVRLVDFMPIHEDETGFFRILRLVEGVTGRLRLRVRFKPTFDFARRDSSFSISSRGVVAASGSESLTLCSDRSFKIRDGLAEAVFDVSDSQRIWFALASERGCAGSDAHAFEQELERTLKYWSDWLAGCSYSGPHHDLVRRSALVLKLLTYQPTGAIIAAPTTSLPERPGGDLNWDYRYSWLRDSGLILDVLQRLGFHGESMRFFDWIVSLCLCGGVQPAYTIRGDRDLVERSLDHLAGYQNSRPVRIGNAAAQQTQYDIYGHVLEAAWLCYSRMPRPMKPEFWQVLSGLANAVLTDWRRPSHGIWEVREDRRHYVYTKLFCWVALDRALRLAEFLHLDGPLDQWRDTRNSIRDHILTQGYSPRAGIFTSEIGGNNVDPSLLVLALTGCVDANDSRMQATVAVIRKSFEHRGLLYRKIAGPGDPWQTEGAFILCTCWLVDYLVLSGKADEGNEILGSLIGYANDLGLFAEEVDPTSRTLLGNFPQGFSHLGVTRSILNVAGSRDN